MRREFERLLLRRVSGIWNPQEGDIDRLVAHYRLVLDWNRRINLTRVTRIEEAVERHYAESIFLASRIEPEVRTVLDVGSGAGFPGIPVAVVRRDLRVTLSESDQRKAVFLREAGRDLPNVRVLGQRVESIDAKFDVAVSRAVRWESLANALAGRCARVVLLVSAEDAASVASSASGWIWGPAIPLPWNGSRVVAEGRAEGDGSSE